MRCNLQIKRGLAAVKERKNGSNERFRSEGIERNKYVEPTC